MHPNVRNGHEALWAKYFNEETQQFYDHEVVDPAQFPTREEVIDCIPIANAASPINDPTLSGSWILTANLRGHRLTGDAEYADKARLPGADPPRPAGAHQRLYSSRVRAGPRRGVPELIRRSVHRLLLRHVAVLAERSRDRG